MKKSIIIAIISILCLSSCSTMQEFGNELVTINGPKDGLKVSYDLKKGKVNTKYKVNKMFTLKY